MSFTFTQTKTQILKKTNTSDNAEIVGELGSWINLRQSLLCSSHPFWFLEIKPAPLLIAVPPTYALLGGWYDVGWLVLQAGVSEYPFNYPVGTKNYIQKLKFIKRYDFAGTFVSNLEIVPFDQFLTYYSYYQTGNPQYITFYEKTDGSYLRVHPVPDEKYLIALDFCLANLPDLVTTSNENNIITTLYPHALVYGGCAEIFDYLGEEEAFMKYEQRFWGSVEKIKLAHKTRTFSSNEVMRYHKGARNARHGWEGTIIVGS